jgi:hypothetical protein
MLEVPPQPDPTILLVEVGSIAHSTGLPGGEDHDEMGVVVERPDEVAVPAPTVLPLVALGQERQMRGWVVPTDPALGGAIVAHRCAAAAEDHLARRACSWRGWSRSLAR